ncbi:hypothetical protein RB653_002833 [Dictyostelium firmibasis]
MFKIKLH